jgi:hypothetical protein
MPDPVSENAEYVVFAWRGIAKLYLSQRGRWQDPGAVAVICARPLGAAQAVTRWLSRIRRAVMGSLRGIDADATVTREHRPGANAVRRQGSDPDLTTRSRWSIPRSPHLKAREVTGAGEDSVS